MSYCPYSFFFIRGPSTVDIGVLSCSLGEPLMYSLHVGSLTEQIGIMY